MLKLFSAFRKNKIWDFNGGIHPPEMKTQSNGTPLRQVPLAQRFVIPLKQHIGAEGELCVSVGDKVLRGQPLTRGRGKMLPVHAPTSGTVTAIAPHSTAHPSALAELSVIIDADGEDCWIPRDGWDDYRSRSREELIERIHQFGVAGLGGAGFPTHVKLSPKEPEKIDYIIANCAECEPYLTSDYRRMIEEPEKLIEGMRIILSLFDNAKGIFGIEDNKPDCIAKLTELTKDEPRMEVKALKTKYPQGSERQLIFATTGRAINSTMLPADAGCIVDNVDTIVAIYHAVKLGRPLMHRIVTITGDAIVDPRNFYVCIGTNYAELVEAAGGFKSQPEKVISGGPMMGMALSTLDVPCAKTFSSLLCFTKDEVAACEPSNCIRCGRCISVCPAGLMPTKLSEIADHGDFALFDELNGCECVECGCCSYICPAKRRLTQSMKTGRREAMALRRKKK